MLEHIVMNQNKFSSKLYEVIGKKSDCKNTVFYMLGPSLMNQNEFSFEVTNAVITLI